MPGLDRHEPDGRRRRKHRTRRALLRATLEILEEPPSNASLGQIAERAGVSERTLFNHFEHRDALIEAAALERAGSLAHTTHPERDAVLPERIDGFVDHRVRLLEALRPLRRATTLVPDCGALPIHVGELEDRMAEEVGRVFGGEVQQASPASRAGLRSALIAAAAGATWESYRSHQGLDLREAALAMRLSIGSLLQAV